MPLSPEEAKQLLGQTSPQSNIGADEAKQLLGQSGMESGQPSSQPRSLLDRVSNNPLVDALSSMGYGASDAIRNLGANVLNKIPGVNIPTQNYDNYAPPQKEPPSFDELRNMSPEERHKAMIDPYLIPDERPSEGWYGVGKAVGNIVPFIGAGALGKVATEALPGLSEIPAPLARIAGNTAYGALTSPHALKGGLEQGAASALFEGIPAGAQKLSQASQFMRPQPLIDSIKKQLSVDKVSAMTEKGNKLYNDLYEVPVAGKKIGERGLYDPVPSQGNELSVPGQELPAGRNLKSESKYFELPADQRKRFFNMDVKKVEGKFLDIPNLKNSRELDSQFGTEIRDLQYKWKKDGALSTKDRNTLITYQTAQSRLRQDQHNMLNSVDPTGQLSDQLKAANTHWARVVKPLQDTAFAVGNLKKNSTQQQFVNALNKVSKKKNLPSEIQEQLPELEQRLSNKEMTQKILGPLGAAAIPLSHGAFGPAAVAGALGYTFRKPLSSILGALEKQLTSGASPLYKGARTIALSNLLSSERGKNK